MMIGMSLIFLISLHAEKPSSFGIMISIMIKVVIVESAETYSCHAVGSLCDLVTVEFGIFPDDFSYLLFVICD